jgi:hypothetical protein
MNDGSFEQEDESTATEVTNTSNNCEHIESDPYLLK